MDRRLTALRLGLGFALGVTTSAFQASEAAQPEQKIVRLGFVSPVSASPTQDPLWIRLRELGWEEGRNLVVERRFAQGHYDRLPTLMSELPRLSTVALITNPRNPGERGMVNEVASAAEARHLKLVIVPLRDSDSLQSALQQARRAGQALLLLGDPVFAEHRQEIISFCSHHRFPALYGLNDFVQAGGLMSYGLDRKPIWRRAAEYVDKILRGARPEELPVEQPTQYLLTVNTGVAKTLGITIPESILLRADEVIR